MARYTTDDAGNFLMPNPPVGANQILFIDGGPASTPGKSLPIIPYKEEKGVGSHFLTRPSRVR
jgi:hypothetical protein